MADDSKAAGAVGSDNGAADSSGALSTAAPVVAVRATAAAVSAAPSPSISSASSPLLFAVGSPMHRRPMSSYLDQSVALQSTVAQLFKARAEAQTTCANAMRSSLSIARRQISEHRTAGLALAAESGLLATAMQLLKTTESETDALEASAASLFSIGENLAQDAVRRRALQVQLADDRASLEKTLEDAGASTDKAQKANEGAVHVMKVARANADMASLKTNSGSDATDVTAAVAAAALRGGGGKNAAALGSGGGMSEVAAAAFRTKAHNEYCVELARERALSETHFNTTLPALLQLMETAHEGGISVLANAISNASRAVAGSASASLGANAPLQEHAATVDAATELRLWIEGTGADVFVAPARREFVRPPLIEGDPVPQGEEKVARSEASVDTIERRVVALTGEVASLASDIGRASNAIVGLENLYEKYAAEPSFGCADDVLPKLLAARVAVRDQRMRMQLCHVELAALTDTSLAKARARSLRRRPKSIPPVPDEVIQRAAAAEAEANGEMEEEEEGDSSADEWEEDYEYSESCTRAVCITDYAAGSPDELDVQAGDVVELRCFAPGEPWWSVRLGEKQGLLPGKLLKPFVGTAQNQVFTLYPYQAKKEDELSFPASTILTLLEPADEPGWSRGIHNGVEGIFPTDYVNQRFVRAPEYLAVGLKRQAASLRNAANGCGGGGEIAGGGSGSSKAAGGPSTREGAGMSSVEISAQALMDSLDAPSPAGAAETAVQVAMAEAEAAADNGQ